MNFVEFHQLGPISMQPGSNSLIPIMHGCSEHVDAIHCIIKNIYEQRGETTWSQFQGKSAQEKKVLKNY